MRRHCLALLLLAAGACGPAPPATDRKLVVLAVDGLDPELTSRMMREGRLPHLAALAEISGLVRVVPAPGAESTSAWASVATGVNAGAHGIFDLVVPDGPGGRPSLGPLRRRPPRQWFGRWWSEGLAYDQVRTAEPFWVGLGRAGIRTSLLFVPGTFPPVGVPNGTVVAGMPLPDWNGAPGSAYTWLASEVPAGTPEFTRYGGRVVRLQFERNVARATIRGLPPPVSVDLPLVITWNPEARSANIALGDETVYLAEGQQSRWIEVGARLNLATRIEGLVRLHLPRAGNDVQLLVSAIQWHPHAPPSPISTPPRAAAALFERLATYRTLAWPDTGWALADGYLADAAFLEAQDDTFTDRAEALLHQLESGGWDFAMAGIETIDTTTRLMWRMMDPGHGAYDAAVAPRLGAAVGRQYQRLDELVGAVRERLPADADLVVLSPHGIYTARSVVDLNRWLADQTLLAWRTPPAPVTLAALADPTAWPDTVDWPRTMARSMGAGHIYLNVRGREPDGVVEPGAPYDALIARLQRDLELLVDPLSGRRVVARVRTGRELFRGAHAGRAPDLVVTFSPGYRASWDSMLGGAADSVVSRNYERWSAEHASADEQHVPGVWLSTMPLTSDTLSVLDIAPTLLAAFGEPPPAGAEGIARLARVARDPRP